MITRLNADWDSRVNRYRIYDPKKPEKTIAYVHDLTAYIEWYLNYLNNYDGKGKFYYTIEHGSLKKWEEFNK